MAARIFSVCTSVAAEGIEHSSVQLAVADDESGFARLVVERLAHSGLSSIPE
jgi:hypothetical protein